VVIGAGSVAGGCGSPVGCGSQPLLYRADRPVVLLAETEAVVSPRLRSRLEMAAVMCLAVSAGAGDGAQHRAGVARLTGWRLDPARLRARPTGRWAA